MSIMSIMSLLPDRLRQAGIDDVVHMEPAVGGMAAVAGIATRAGHPPIFVKSFAGPPADGLFDAEAEGLRVLREHGGVRTPEVVLAGRDLLALSVLRPRLDTEVFWERLAPSVARLHMSTVHDRFGWHRDNWLGRYRQDNTWNDNGYEFFARCRLLRWLPERRVRAALDPEDRRALERLCDRLPELLPAKPACLTHGDLWQSNVLATPDGEPALIDPAVSYTWAEVDLAHLWCTPHPVEADRFFAVYADIVGLDAGWRERMPIIQLRQHLAVIAQFDHDWGAADQVRSIVAPFRRSPS